MNDVRLVEPSDKMFATEYAYFVMDQMTTCVFTESDRLGKRKCHKVKKGDYGCQIGYLILFTIHIILSKPHMHVVFPLIQ